MLSEAPIEAPTIVAWAEGIFRDRDQFKRRGKFPEPKRRALVIPISAGSSSKVRLSRLVIPKRADKPTRSITTDNAERVGSRPKGQQR
jgi:hypothetical protein